MNPFIKTVIPVILLSAGPIAMAGSEKDCLLEGTVLHNERAGEDTATMVQINSISKYDEDARCKVRRSEKMEFKLPQDTRLQDAPSGSEVKYRYRTDDSGQSNAELISVGA
tara:strand:- start:203 stop:535 length:333 start_codon:yes stop_codon:yes gene_type:complete